MSNEMRKLSMRRINTRFLKLKRIEEKPMRKMHIMRIETDFLTLIKEKSERINRIKTLLINGVSPNIINQKLKEEKFLWFIDYYINHSSNKLNALGIFKDSNDIVKNMFYILDNLKRMGHDNISVKKLRKLQESYYFNTFELDLYENIKGINNYIIKDGIVLERGANLEPKKSHKGSIVMLNLGDGLYKAIPYQVYERLYNISNVEVDYRFKYYLEEDCYEPTHRKEYNLNTPESICIFFCIIRKMLHDTASQIGEFDNTLVDVEVSHVKVTNKKGESEILDQYKFMEKYLNDF